MLACSRTSTFHGWGWGDGVKEEVDSSTCIDGGMGVSRSVAD